MKKMLEAVSEMIETFAISLILFLAVYLFLAFPEIVVGTSMEPTLAQGERLLVERITPKMNKLKRGDIVIFNPPGNGNIDYVKRIIGMPGESLTIRDCSVYLINSSGQEEKLNSDYLSVGTCTAGDSKVIAIPDDSFYVLGDNRSHSADSRVFGPLKKDRISGKVFIRFWPLGKFSQL
jgi:signal peptidase I